MDSILTISITTIVGHQQWQILATFKTMVSKINHLMNIHDPFLLILPITIHENAIGCFVLNIMNGNIVANSPHRPTNTMIYDLILENKQMQIGF